MKLQVEYVPISTIKPYKRNAKLHPQEQIEQIKNSMKEFGNIDPIGVWHDEIVEGHGRYEALKQMGVKEIPIIRLDDLTDEQRKAYALAHNKLTMNSDFDLAILDSEIADLSIDMSKFGFDVLAEEMQEQAEKYTSKVNIPQYEPTGDDVSLWECYDTTKADQLIEEIENAPFLSDEQKKFLKISAYRHVVFNYRKIAEYYAKVDGGVQKLMEDSALVIIDYENAIANGYVKLSERLRKMCHEV